MANLQLLLLKGRVSICRLPSDSPFPDWLDRGPVWSVTRTPDETSVVCQENLVPPSVRQEPGWRMFQLQGPFPFDAVGILAAVLEPLRKAHVPILALSTFDTDYVMVREQMLDHSIQVLESEGHSIQRA